MRNVWTIAKREFNLYIISPIAYVVALIILLILGIIFYANISSAVTALQSGQNYRSNCSSDHRPACHIISFYRSGSNNADHFR